MMEGKAALEEKPSEEAKQGQFATRSRGSESKNKTDMNVVKGE